MKEHSCTDNLKQLTPTAQSSSTNDGNRKGHVPHSNTFLMKEKLKKKNNIRKTYKHTRFNTLQVQKAPERK